jgi:rhamnose transport system permease protein
MGDLPIKDPAATLVTQRDAAPARPLWQVILIRPEMVTLILLIGAIVIGGRLSPFFNDFGFIMESSTYYFEYSIVALVLTLVIISGEIDLSPASMMALSACVFAASFQAGAPIWLAIIASLASGLLMGLFNAVLIIGFRLPSIIVTIGTLTLYRGLAQVMAGDRSIGHFPGWFNGINYREILDIPVPVYIFLIASILVGLFLAVTVAGRQIYQIGTSEIAARHAGIRVRRIKMGLFLAMGLTASIAGLLNASRLASVRYDMASGAELQMVLMVMLGGTYIFGGRGTILGTFLSSWLLVVIATGMTVADIAVTSQLIVMGILLIASIIATNAIYARSQR